MSKHLALAIEIDRETGQAHVGHVARDLPAGACPGCWAEWGVNVDHDHPADRAEPCAYDEIGSL